MMKKRIIGGGVVAVIIIFGLVINFQAQEPVPEPEVAPEPIEAALPNPYTERMLSEYESEMLDMLKKTKTPALAIAIVQDSTTLFMKTYGVREVGKPDSIDEHTVFRLATSRAKGRSAISAPRSTSSSPAFWLKKGF